MRRAAHPEKKPSRTFEGDRDATPEDPPVYTKSPEELGFVDVEKALAPPTGLLAGSPGKPRRKKPKPKSNGAMEARASMAGLAAAAEAVTAHLKPPRRDVDACDRAMSDLFRELRSWRLSFGPMVMPDMESSARLRAAIDCYEAALCAVVDEDERLAALRATDGGGETQSPP